MALFSLSRSNVALSTTADLLTVVGAAGRLFRIKEISVGGMSTTASANELGIFRSTGGTTGTVAVTAVPLQTAQAAAGFTNFTTWVAQPTLGNCLLRLPCNASGGLYRWVAPPDMNILFNGTEQLSLRSVVGTGTVSIHIILEEF